MRKCMNILRVQARIKKIEGQLRTISVMVDKDIPCEDILIQINATKSAMHKVRQLVLEGHLQRCVRDGIEQCE